MTDTVTFQLEHRGELTLLASEANNPARMSMQDAYDLGLLPGPQVVTRAVTDHVRCPYTRDEPVTGGTHP